MIGDTPKGAPLKCRLGRHEGQERGGTMVFTCSNCGGSFWQTKDYSHITVLAEARLALGDESAVDWAHDKVKNGEIV